MWTREDAEKLNQTPLQAGVVQVFAETSPVIQYMPFMDVAGNAYSFNREQALPGVSFREINEVFPVTTGAVQNVTENLKVFGGSAKVDRALVRSQGNLNDLRAIQTNMHAKAAALDFTRCFFKGESATSPKEFDGLQKRLVGAQVLDAAGALTLAKLDELVDAVQGAPSALFMSKTMRRQVNALMRAAGQAVETVSNVFGVQIPAYAGIPIGVIEEDAAGNEILGFEEVGSTASVYAVRFGVSEYCSGLQCGPLEVHDLGLVQSWYQTDIEWLVSFTLFNGKSAARLKGITLA
ncbi:major capsid protein [Desulfovibrio cuneatus]|uniref:major capsid protein n=1 Tax=Desulfovibrio cuneatus TaxID=159728 RepID=UPI00040C9CBD|nr:hypothetical protein [Desulfovibrio cuneatus]